MATRFESLKDSHRAFIARQHIFFVATAARESRVNISPRSTTCLRVLSDTQVLYFDQTGSGSETAAHLLADGRMTIMFCSFDKTPLILRLFGKGRSLARGGAEYAAHLAAHFDGKELPGARQMILLDADLVISSCGYGVPFFDYVEERHLLDDWASRKTEAELATYRRQKNSVSLDGLPTGLFEPPAG